MCAMHSRYKWIKGFLCLICLFVLMTVGCGKAYAAGEEEPQDRIEWDYDMDRNVFTIHNAEEIFSDQPVLHCLLVWPAGTQKGRSGCSVRRGRSLRPAGSGCSS